MRLLQPVLMKEGFITELKKNGQTYSLSSLSCPYYRIAPDHPEVCALDNALIQTFLDAPIIIESCIFKNADRCIYQIPITTNED